MLFPHRLQAVRSDQLRPDPHPGRRRRPSARRSPGNRWAMRSASSACPGAKRFWSTRTHASSPASEPWRSAAFAVGRAVISPSPGSNWTWLIRCLAGLSLLKSSVLAYTPLGSLTAFTCMPARVLRWSNGRRRETAFDKKAAKAATLKLRADELVSGGGSQHRRLRVPSPLG
jgi:hypothetical protein